MPWYSECLCWNMNDFETVCACDISAFGTIRECECGLLFGKWDEYTLYVYEDDANGMRTVQKRSKWGAFTWTQMKTETLNGFHHNHSNFWDTFNFNLISIDYFVWKESAYASHTFPRRIASHFVAIHFTRVLSFNATSFDYRDGVGVDWLIWFRVDSFRVLRKSESRQKCPKSSGKTYILSQHIRKYIFISLVC